MVAAGFLSRYLNGTLPYVTRSGEMRRLSQGSTMHETLKRIYNIMIILMEFFFSTFSIGLSIKLYFDIIYFIENQS